MKARRVLFWAGSGALTIFLLIVVMRIGKIDFRATLEQLLRVRWQSFAKLLILNVILVYLSTEKWRSVDNAWRRASDISPSRITAFTHTSAGLVLGIFLPVQLAMSVARTFGNHTHGRALRRGTAATLFEQGFDVLTVGFLAAASTFTYYHNGRGLTWSIAAVTGFLIAFVAAGSFVNLFRKFAGLFARRHGEPKAKLGQTLQSLSELQHSKLLNASLARRLLILSLLRFGVVTLMSSETAEAIGVHIPIWEMACSIPFVVMASILAVTPGGLGVSELTSVSTLRMFGTSASTAAQWALANRVLVSASYLSVAFAVAILSIAKRTMNGGGANLTRFRLDENAVVEEHQSL